MTTFQADLAETQYVDGTTARFAYRRLGPRSGIDRFLPKPFDVSDLLTTISHSPPP